jgi:membrane-associated phospholipid phosphatase
MNRLSLWGSRTAMLCAGLVFLLSPFSGAAQQPTSACDTTVNSFNAVPGLRAAIMQPASQRSAANQGAVQDQTSPQALVKENRGAPASFGQFFKNIARDQARMWTSPLRIRRHDLVWLIPIAGATAAAIATDKRALAAINPNALYVRATRDFTVTGHPYALLGAAGATYMFGRGTHNDRLKEAGALGSEAIIDSMLLVGGLKMLANRERPDQGTGQGRFWPQGLRDFPYGTAFPSGHAAASWALARVIAGEYPDRPVVKIVGYTWAALVSVSRVTGRKHFPSDALVGSVVGYLIGDFVVRHRASDRQNDTPVTISPFTDTRTRTRGVTVSFSPEVFKSGHAHD